MHEYLSLNFYELYMQPPWLVEKKATNFIPSRFDLISVGQTTPDAHFVSVSASYSSRD